MAQRDTRTLVVHLFRRAGFGLRPDEIDHFTSLGVQGSVDFLTNYEGVVDSADQAFPPPDLSAFYTAPLPAAQRATATQKRQGQMRAQAKLAIQDWWLNRMLTTTVPLREKMTLFWHGHFATALSKAQAPFMLQQNQLFRSMALGNLNTLLKAVTQDPAMLVWLDGDQNRAGKANEYYARESMELFTIGVGNFTEPDVREGARALTGWTLPRHAIADAWNGTQIVARLIPHLHDTGVKTYLGHTGNLGSDDVANILTAHPHAGPFLVRQLFSFFATDNAEVATIQPFVDTYYRTKYDLKAVMRQMFLSDAFYADAAFQQRISSPTEFVVGTIRELGATVPPRQMTRALALMGQDLFNPPNVGGWPGGVTWINASTLVERFNFAGVQGVGYPNPNLSHFRSTDIWQSALPTGVTDTGWLGRYLDGALADERNPLKAISIGSLLPKALWAKNTMVPAVQSLKAFRFLAAQHNAAEAQKVISTFQRMYGTVSDAEGPYLSLVQMADASAYQATIELGKTSAAPPKTKYPASPLAEELKLVSQIIAANLGTRVFLVTQGGFDDHAQEAIAHPKLMKDFGDAVAAFYQDMTSHGRADQVLLMTFSEFGRRPLENASNGTDHGTAAPMLVIGGAVKGGL